MLLLPAQHLWASSQATSKSELLAKNCVFVAGYTLTAVCAAVSTGGSSHPTVASFASFIKKEKRISIKVIDALWEGGRRYRGKLLLKEECPALL